MSMLCNHEITAARKPGSSNATKAASKTLSFASTLGNGPAAFNSGATSFALTASTKGTGLIMEP